MTAPIAVGTVSTSARHASLREALTTLEQWGHARGWAGSDPYDGLNATRFTAGLKRAVKGRQALTQLVKRSPIDLRPLLGVPAARSAAALAHVVSSYALGAVPGQAGRLRLEEALTALEELRCKGFEEACWGYHFDVQTRVFFYPAGSPNTIATAFAGLALLDAYGATREERLLELAQGVGDFFLRHVPQTDDGDGAYFGYLVGDRTPIHNANVLVCVLLARICAHVHRSDMREAAEAGLRWTVARQRADGSWPYGEWSHLSWVDNFHTGYVLDSIMLSASVGIEIDGGEAVTRGLAYYREKFFEQCGAPRYTPQSLYPIDAQCVAQAIKTMALAARDNPSYASFAWAVFDFAQRRMRKRDGSYLFQRRRWWSNTTPHIRWVAAPMFEALTILRKVLADAP